ncbi:phosphoribosylformylglycinamidine synthase subunit PurQ, partial [Motilimonas sp. 1_MG-2023]|uniref:phosphoribosylformylglycinamidine synthase subunit PurQ n=1 Tax=Motilimonas sp. 1_MG-2023 TaxID=3062672 RepID=UPI0026E17C39
GYVLGSGEGCGLSFIFTDRSRDVLQSFFKLNVCFAIGVCNGFQKISNQKDLITVTELLTLFVLNK